MRCYATSKVGGVVDGCKGVVVDVGGAVEGWCGGVMWRGNVEGWR